MSFEEAFHLAKKFFERVADQRSSDELWDVHTSMAFGAKADGTHGDPAYVPEFKERMAAPDIDLVQAFETATSFLLWERGWGNEEELHIILAEMCRITKTKDREAELFQLWKSLA